MRLCAVSDMHGHLPAIPDCDILVIAGDIGLGFREIEADVRWWADSFLPWLEELKERRIVVIGIAGNHDFICQQHRAAVERLPWIYLQDSGVELGGLKFWGTPWQPNGSNWAFDATESELAQKFAAIPDETDVLICHGPPAGILDRPGGRARYGIGSTSLNRAVQRVMPGLCLFGHVHHPGVENVEGVVCANVSVVDPNYKMIYQPTVFDL